MGVFERSLEERSHWFRLFCNVLLIITITIGYNGGS